MPVYQVATTLAYHHRGDDAKALKAGAYHVPLVLWVDTWVQRISVELIGALRAVMGDPNL
jgi:hypothetical protein